MENETADGGSACVQCISTYRSELTLEGLKFKEKTGAAWRWQWGHDPSRCFKSWRSHFMFRIFIVLAWFGVFVWSLATSEDHPRYLIWLTNWGLLIELVYFLLALYCTWLTRRDDLPDTPPTIVKATWFVHAVAFPTSFIIFVMYWIFVFTPPVYAISVATHAVNFALMLVDVLVSSQTYVLAEGIIFFGFAAIYIIWSAIHSATEIGNGDGESYIYSVFDWSKPGAAAIFLAIVVLVGIPLVVCLMRLVVYIRDKYSQRSGNFSEF